MIDFGDPHVQAVTQNIALTVLSALATVVTALVGMASKKILQWLDGKAHAATFECAMSKIESVTKSAVDEVEQTVVRKLKSEDQWNAETAKGARDTAVLIAKNHLGQRGLKELEGCLGQAQDSIEGMLRTHVEKNVLRMGTSGNASPFVAMGK